MKTKILFLPIILFTFVTIATAETSLQVSSSVTPSILTPGNDGYIQLVITNIGTSYIDKVKIRLDSLDSPLIPITSFTTSGFGGLAAGKSISTIFKFSVPSDTPSGFYVAKFTVSACDSSNICKDTDVYAPITVKTTSALQLTSITPDSVKVGEKINLTFNLENSGSDITNINLIWSNPAITPLGMSNRIYIPSMKANEVRQIPVETIVQPDITPGVYPFTILITYTDKTGTQQTLNTTVGITITSKFNFVVTLDSQDILYPGTTGSAVISIANAGKQEARFLTVEAPESQVFTQIIPGKVYVGNLKSDDYDSERFTFKVAPVTPGIYPFKVRLEYQDLYGNNYNETYEVNLRVSSVAVNKKGLSTSTILLLVVIAAIIIYIIYKKVKK